MRARPATALGCSAWLLCCARNTPATAFHSLQAPPPESRLVVVVVPARADAATATLARRLVREAQNADVPVMALQTGCVPERETRAVAPVASADVPRLPPASACGKPGVKAYRVDLLGRARQLPVCPRKAPCPDAEPSKLHAFDLVVLQGDPAPKELEPFLAPRPPKAPPLFLLMDRPLESAGVRGLGGRRADASIRYAPRPVRAAYREGTLAGVIAGGEAEVQVFADLTRATMRADRIAPPHPVFQVVVGTVPRRRAPGHRLLRLRSMAAAADLLLLQPGLVRMTFFQDALRIEAIRSGTPPRTAEVTVPFPPPHLGPRDFGSMLPCPRCSPVPGDARP